MIVVVILLVALAWFGVRAIASLVRRDTVPPLAAAPGTSSVILPLARVESRRLLRHPAFLIGVALWTFTSRMATDGQSPFWTASIAVVIGIVPLAWLTLVACNLAVLRDRRSGLDELAGTLPAGAGVRTYAHAMSPVVVAPVAAALLVGWAVWFDTTPGLVGRPLLWEFATGVLIVVGGGVVGVAVGRWLPAPFLAVPAIIATALLAEAFTTSYTSPGRFLGFHTPPHPSGLPALEIRGDAWHVVWLVAWTGVLIAVAVARHRFTRDVAVVVVASMTLAAVAGWVQTRPLPTARAVELAAVIERPAPHQSCRTAGTVRYCAYEDFTPHIDGWQRVVEGVLARVPAPVRARPLEVRQRVNPVVGNADCGPSPLVDTLPKSVRKRVSVDEAWPADGHVHPGVWPDALPCGGRTLGNVFVAVQAGSWAVGLEPAAWGHREECAADGQARTVVALWLAGQGAGDQYLRALAEEPARDANGHYHFGRVSEQATGWNTPPTFALRIHERDMAVALQLLGHDDDVVRRVVVERWAQLVDPNTSVTELTAAVGLEGAVGAPIARSTCPVA